jgi:prevent-host-death family protein
MAQWQASAARQNFSEIMDAAVEGTPQFVQRRDGREVVIVSRDYFERSKPSLKSYLLEKGVRPDGYDEFDRIMYDITGSPALAPPENTKISDQD